MKVNNLSELSELIQQAVHQGLQNLGSTLLVAETTRLNAKEYLNVTEAAEYTRLAKQTVYQKVSMRTIPFIKKGGRVIFRRSELQNWMNEGSKKWLRK